MAVNGRPPRFERRPHGALLSLLRLPPPCSLRAPLHLHSSLLINAARRKRGLEGDSSPFSLPQEFRETKLKQEKERKMKRLFDEPLSSMSRS